MTQMTDNIIDRDQLQDAMIQQILDDMDIKTMMAILYDNMSESYDKYSVDELIAEVEEYYPQLLENWWTLKSQSISQSPRIASTILFIFLMSLALILLTTKNVMMR